MNAAAHYRYLAQQGRAEFLAAAAPAALVRFRGDRGDGSDDVDEGTLTVEHAMGDDGGFLAGEPSADPDAPDERDELELFPLVKKPGASFPDRITIGRTANNDLAFNEVSISRFHAYLRQDGGRWLVADAGSKNGSWLDGLRLPPRQEKQVFSRGAIRIGDVELKFLLASDLYAVVGGR